MVTKPRIKYTGILNILFIMFIIYVYLMSMPQIFIKRKDLIFVGFYPFWHFENWDVIVGI
jgi:hypothetical protein